MKRKTTELVPGAMSQATNYPANNVRGDIFQVVLELAKVSGCETLRKVVSGKIYYRAVVPETVDGVDGPEEGYPIVKVDREKRDRMMRLITDNLKDGSPFRLSLDEYLYLKWLCKTYWGLAELQTMQTQMWVQIRDRINEISPGFYLQAEMLEE